MVSFLPIAIFIVNRHYYFNSFNWNEKRFYLKIRFYIKRFYINVLYGGHQKVKRLMYFSPPTKCLYENILSNILHKYRLR